jgi:pyruvate-ferredoxin/flavodoxin oxidoreductase
MIDDDLVIAHRKRGLTLITRFMRGTAQNPDVYFQGRETVNPFYINCPDIVQAQMDKFAKLTEGAINYMSTHHGAPPDAGEVIVIMGSGAEAVEETVSYLTAKEEKTGVLKVRLYRPFSIRSLLMHYQKTVKTITVLDKQKNRISYRRSIIS